LAIVSIFASPPLYSCRTTPIPCSRRQAFGILAPETQQEAMAPVRRLILVALVALMLLAPAAKARAASPASRVLVLVVDRTSLAQWAAPGLPNLHQLLVRSAVGLMNSNTGGGDAEGPSALTLGASAHLTGPAVLTFRPILDRQAQALSSRVSHVTPSRLVGLDAIRRANRHLSYAFTLGALGGLLEGHGLLAAALGDANRPGHEDASFAALAMDPRGRVLADVSGALDVAAPGAPFGVEVDNRSLVQATLQAVRVYPLTVVTYGDTERANALWPRSAAPLRRRLGTWALRHFDRFLGALLPRLPRHTLLVIVSPLPSWPMVLANATLTPLLLHGDGYRTGYLTSASTHRAGIVTNVDLAPTILHALDLAFPPTFFGQPLTVLPHADPVARLLGEAAQIAFVSRLRQPLLHVVVFCIVLVYVAAVVALSSAKVRLKLRRGLSVALEVVLFLPFAMLIFPLFHTRSELVAFLVVAAAAAVPAFLTILRPTLLDRLLVPCLLTIALLLLDLFTGQHLIKGSPLGYDPQIGARYYGIGNEFMGVLIGASCLGLTALVDRWGRQLLPVLWGASALVLVALVTPDLGTKVGGAITATAAFAVVAYRVLGRRIGWREAAAIGALALVLMASIVAFDLVAHGQAARTDVGRTSLLIYQGGVLQALYIVVRKLSTDAALVQNSYWSLLLGVAVAATVAVLARRSGIGARLAHLHPHLAHGITGALVGAGAALLFNDTGVVAACTDIIFPVSAALLFALQGDPAQQRALPRAS
jgi:hypothetical protein